MRAVLRAFLTLLLPLALACCGGGHGRPATSFSAAGRYAAPGPPEDPWGPYIHEAALRFDVPERWVREVMRQESGGHEYLHGQAITSDAGAMGLMQVMPETYATLRDHYSFGPDPYDPHDNILAGTAYIHEMYEQYGAPGFLAAYNAGPLRLESYLAGQGSLPNETVNYLATIAPRLGDERPLTGPLAAYADTGGVPAAEAPIPRAYAAADPGPIAAQAPAMVHWGGAVTPGSSLGMAATPRPSEGCASDPNAAYDPAAPCGAPQMQVQAAPPPPGRARFALIPAAVAAETTPSALPGAWAVQVGAFSDPGLARATAEAARTRAPGLEAAQTVIGTTAPFGVRVLYRARLAGLSQERASAACRSLSAQGVACITVPPGL